MTSSTIKQPILSEGIIRFFLPLSTIFKSTKNKTRGGIFAILLISPTIASNTFAEIFEVNSTNAPIYFAGKLEGYLSPGTKLSPLGQKEDRFLVEVYIDGETKLYAWIPQSSVSLTNSDPSAIIKDKIHAFATNSKVEHLSSRQEYKTDFNMKSEHSERRIVSNRISREDLGDIVDKIDRGNASFRNANAEDITDKTSDFTMTTHGKLSSTSGKGGKSKKQHTAPDIDPDLGSVPDDTPENPTVSKRILPPPKGNAKLKQTLGKGTMKQEITTEQVIASIFMIIIAVAVFYVFAIHKHDAKPRR